MTGTIAHPSGVAAGTIGQIIAIVVGALLISVATYVFTKNRVMYHDVREMKAALITPEPTPLTPHPTPGLIDVVVARGTQIEVLDEKVDTGLAAVGAEMVAISEKMEHVAENLGRVGSSLAKVEVRQSDIAEKTDLTVLGVAALVTDTKANDGTSSRDALARIEDAVGTTPPEPDPKA